MKHGTTGYRRGCRCDECRQAAVAYQARIAAEGRGWKARPRKARRCFDCGVILKAGGHCADGQPRCLKHRAEKRDRDQRRATRRRLARKKLARAAEGTTGKNGWPFVVGVCAWCSEAFTRRGGVSGFCSKVCNKKDRRRRNRKRYGKQWISDAERFAIYDRDDWICQLCFEPVDRKAKSPDVWSPSLDHIEPRSMALIPDDSPINLRLVHFWCNSVRGDGTHHKDFFEEAS